MSSLSFYRLTTLSVLDIRGKDAIKIVNNLTTNEIVSLDFQTGRETFVTDVKGKTVGHVYVYRLEDSFRLIGAGGQSKRMAAHFDRYTIVEDAVVEILDQQLIAVALPPEFASTVVNDFSGTDQCRRSVELAEMNASGYEVDWLGRGTMILLSLSEETTLQHLQTLGLSPAGGPAFHHARTVGGFPWIGIDFDDRNLPQEVDRDQQAISFTKGCYLGQETVARLDAMGQVQKKLVRWQTTGAIPDPNVEVVSDGKTVGRLTSIAPTSENEAWAIGIARRSHFDKGMQASGPDDTFTAVVT